MQILFILILCCCFSGMSSYPLTPPSSLEDSPQSVLLVASPNSNTFEYETYEHSPMQIPHTFAVQPNIMIDPNSLIKTETSE